jgi:hypothetical protein
MRTGDGEPEYGYLRQTEEFDWLLIPEDEIDEHDELKGEILRSEWGTEAWYALTDKYNDLYMAYRVEGDMQSLRVVLE